MSIQLLDSKTFRKPNPEESTKSEMKLNEKKATLKNYSGHPFSTQQVGMYCKYTLYRVMNIKYSRYVNKK